MARKSEGRKARKSSSSRQGGARRANREAGSGERSDYRQKVQETKLTEGSKKGGCFPKLFMLLLPFAAAGTYLLLRS